MKTEKITFPEVKIGDRFECLKTIKFTDGAIHKKGRIYTAGVGETAYNSVRHSDYRKV